MLTVAVQAQASQTQDLVKLENEDKKLILMSVDVLQKVDPNVQLYSNESPFGKLLQLVNNVNTNFDSLEKFATQKVLDKFKNVWMQNFQKMIEDDRVRLNKRLHIISDALSKGGKLYKSCLIFPKFTVDVNKQIGVCQGKLASISQSFDPNINLTNNIQGQIIAINDQISSFQVDKDTILRKVSELQNLIAPQLDNMLSYKVYCMKEMARSVPFDLKELEIHAIVFSAFITILDNLKSGWDTHLGILKSIYADIFKYLQNIFGKYLCI